MTDRLRPRKLVPVIGAIAGGALGFAYYWFWLSRENPLLTTGFGVVGFFER